MSKPQTLYLYGRMLFPTQKEAEQYASKYGLTLAPIRIVKGTWIPEEEIEAS